MGRSALEEIKTRSKRNLTKEVMRGAVSLLDVTTLNVKDTAASVERFVRGVLDKVDSCGLPDPASICVMPPYIGTVGIVLGERDIAITAAVGCFPLAQSYLEVKLLECTMALENGADEYDVVMNVGAVLESDYDRALSELIPLKKLVGDDNVFKVIIESGELRTTEKIERATSVAIAVGADFVKTSTGKRLVGATPEAVVAMCGVIKRHFEASGERVGIKIAGGVSGVESLALYYTIVEESLGAEWLTPSLFRIGASSLLDAIIEYLK